MRQTELLSLIFPKDMFVKFLVQHFMALNY